MLRTERHSVTHSLSLAGQGQGLRGPSGAGGRGRQISRGGKAVQAITGLLAADALAHDRERIDAPAAERRQCAVGVAPVRVASRSRRSSKPSLTIFLWRARTKGGVWEDAS